MKIRLKFRPIVIAFAWGVLSALSLPAQTPETSLNPQVQKVVDEVSEKRMTATLTKLESFGTRYVLTTPADPSKGINAAKEWIHSQFQSYSPRLQVSYQKFHVNKGAGSLPGRVIRDVDLENVVAVLPGTVHPDRYVIVSAHYDSVNYALKPKSTDAERIAEETKNGMDESEAKKYIQLFPPDNDRGSPDFEETAEQSVAPGVTDDGSGIAAVLELARVMSQYQFEKNIVFIAFAGEEIGLEGSKAYAAIAKGQHMDIEAVLNNDIIGNDVSGNGRSETNVIRAFADGPEDSPNRAILRYTKQIAERYVPSMTVEMVFHRDRFNRGGDHTSFVTQGFGAVRFTSAAENYENEHTATDTFANTSPPYATRAARMNAAVLASLALAPLPPVVNYTIETGKRKGSLLPMLTRGKSGYDAVLRWIPGTEADLAGYAVVIRHTTSPDWEREIWVGNVTSYTIPDFSIDDVVIGLKAVDRDGNQSLVSSYLEPINPRLLAPAESPSTTK